MKRIGIMLFVSLLLLSVYGCAPNNTSTDVPEKVVIGTQVLVEPDAIAIAEDWFSETLGTKVEILTFDAGRDVIKAMASGDVDIGTAGCTLASISIANEQDIQIIGIQTVLGDTDALVVNKELGIKNAEDLRGRTIATTFSSPVQYCLIKYLEINEIDINDVDIVDMSAKDIPAAFQRGDIDGAYTWDPQCSAIIDNGGEYLVTSRQMAEMNYMTMDLNLVNADFAKKYPNIIEAYCKCIDKAVNVYNSDRKTAGEDLEEWVGIDAESSLKLADSGIWLTAKEQASDKWLGGDAVCNVLYDNALLLYEMGSIDKEPFLENFKDAVRPEYMAAVN